MMMEEVQVTEFNAGTKGLGDGKNQGEFQFLPRAANGLWCIYKDRDPGETTKDGEDEESIFRHFQLRCPYVSKYECQVWSDIGSGGRDKGVRVIGSHKFTHWLKKVLWAAQMET
jgi:hypothetical protein